MFYMREKNGVTKFSFNGHHILKNTSYDFNFILFFAEQALIDLQISK